MHSVMNPTDRQYQDVGFDGLHDTAEANKICILTSVHWYSFGARFTGYQRASEDPSADNFKPYRDAFF